MAAKVSSARTPELVRQFSIFTPNRMGRLHDIVALLAGQNVHVLALTILDTTDSSIMRLVTDDPDRARDLLKANDFPFTESELVVVEFEAATDLNRLMSALLEAEININYLYSFIPHPQGKPLLALSMEDNDMAQKVLTQHQFRVFKQADISR